MKVFESGAILIHLADKNGRFLARGGQARADGLAWLFFQVGGVGPMFGQLGHFASRKEQDAYAFERYRAEVVRLTEVLDGRLGASEYLAGEYGIADMATYPWVAALPRFGMKLEDHPNVKRWCDALAARPAGREGDEPDDALTSCNLSASRGRSARAKALRRISRLGDKLDSMISSGAEIGGEGMEPLADAGRPADDRARRRSRRRWPSLRA